MTFNKKTIYNIIFFGFIIFLFTPFGLSTRSKLTQGITYVKTFIFSPSLEDMDMRDELDTYDFALRGITNAKDVNLESLKGKVIFINYWATWCPPCRAEMPMIRNLYDDYKDKIVFLYFPVFLCLQMRGLNMKGTCLQYQSSRLIKSGNPHY